MSTNGNKTTTILIVLALGLAIGYLAPKLFAPKQSVDPATLKLGTTPPGGMAPMPNLQQQIASLRAVVQREPNNADAWVKLGNMCFDANMPDDAITAYEKSLALRPNDPNVLTDLGTMYRAKGQFEEALKRFQHAAELDPKHLNSRFNLGVVYFNDLHDTVRARAAYEDYLAAAPNGPQAAEVRRLLASLPPVDAPAPAPAATNEPVKPE